TPLVLGDDQVGPSIDLGFPFEFFGKNESAVRVSSNGFLTFVSSDANPCCEGQPLGSAPQRRRGRALERSRSPGWQGLLRDTRNAAESSAHPLVSCGARVLRDDDLLDLGDRAARGQR